MDSNKLENIYGNMLNPPSKKEEEVVLTEGDAKKPMTAGTVKPGNIEGADKAKAPKNVQTADNKVDAPVEDSAHSNPSVEEGKGKVLVKKESEEIVKPILSFDELYSKTLKEDLNSEEISPAGDIEGENFDDKLGDFDAGDDSGIDEEVDAATELRLLADRLNEIADKISGTEGGEEGLGGEEDLTGEEDLGGEGADIPPVRRESFQHELKKAPKSKFGPSMKNTASNISKNAGKSKTPSKGKDTSGKLSPAPKSTLGPKMSKTVSGSGPAVQGGGGKLFG